MHQINVQLQLNELYKKIANKCHSLDSHLNSSFLLIPIIKDMKTVIALIFCTFLWSTGCSVFGFDISQPFNLSTFQCLKKNGFKFAIIRGYQSFGSVDKNVVNNLQNAKSAGLATSIYMFPCPSKAPQKQVDDLMKAVNAKLYDKIYVDVETNPSPGCGWGSNGKSNCDFLNSILNRIKYYKKEAAVYCSASMWKTIFGSNNACPSVSSNHPLWYPHYDNMASFSDFKAFGGWKKSNIKQYASNINVCGAHIDKNFYP
jgi:GH25 family lysozyme M1 (1,4-beta-N-acetylmuramidase)